MAPKTNCNPLKLTSITTYLQKSRTAHNIKDLEKHLPSVASINGIQVKDYLQSLTDENRINVEKIGSGNWYWSFASQDLRLRERALADATSAHEKATAVVEDLQVKLSAAKAEREDEEGDTSTNPGETREELVARGKELEVELGRLRRELEAYADHDPTELERKAREVGVWRAQAEQHTDEIYSMEGWFRRQGQDEEGLRGMKVMLYGDEFDAEEGGLKELL